jgi:hypothetical protein
MSSGAAVLGEVVADADQGMKSMADGKRADDAGVVNAPLGMRCHFPGACCRRSGDVLLQASVHARGLWRARAARLDTDAAAFMSLRGDRSASGARAGPRTHRDLQSSSA